jgi:hypothetical protein
MAQTKTQPVSLFGQTQVFKGRDGDFEVVIGSLDFFEREKKNAYNGLRDARVTRDNQASRLGAPTPEATAKVAAADETHKAHYGALILARAADKADVETSENADLRAVYEKLVAARGYDAAGGKLPQADQAAWAELVEIGAKAEVERPARASTPRAAREAVQTQKLSPQAMARLALESYRNSGVTAEEISALRAYVGDDGLWQPRAATEDEALAASTIAAFETALIALAPAEGQEPSPAYVAVQSQLAKIATKAAPPAWGPEAKAAAPEVGPVDQPKGPTDENGVEVGMETKA